MQSPRASARISCIDGYRALAIGAVMLHHTVTSPGFPDWLRPILEFVPRGVTAFWVLSGFLITRTLLRDEQRDGAIPFRRFYLRQGIRYLVPLLGYILPITLFIAVRYPGVEWWLLLRPLALDPGTYCITLGGSHLYSMVLQIYFWLAWPVVLKISPPAKRLPIAICLGGIAFAWFDYGRNLAMQFDTCLGRVDYFFGPFLVGSCFALAEKDLLKGRIARFALPIALALAAMSILLKIKQPLAIITGILFSLAWATLVFLLANRLFPRLDRILSWPGLTWLGRISFSVYLWQNLFCLGLSDTPLDRFLINLLASILLGYIAYRLFELPSLRWRSKIKPRSALSPLTVPALRET